MMDKTRCFPGAILAAALVSCALSPEPPPGGSVRPRLLRVGYRVANQYQYLDMDLTIRAKPTFSAPCELPPGAVRTYEVLASSCERSHVLAQVEASAQDELVQELQTLSLEALRASMQSPRRKLDWHFLALAAYLEAVPPLLRREEIDELVRALQVLRNPVPLFEALYPRALHLSEAHVAEFVGDDRVSARLLPLVRSAQLGDLSSLKEIFRLSLEYHAALPSFRLALQALFPVGLNQELYLSEADDGSGSGTAAFINTLEAGLERAEYRTVPTLGWRLERGARDGSAR